MRPDDDSLTGLDTAHRGSRPRGGGRHGGGGRGAIYHLSVRTASRSKGHCARAAAAYIQRTAEYGRDAEAVADLVYTESGHMPGWADAEAGATAYWDAADLHERANGRLFKRLEFALPTALDAGEQRELAVTFAHHLTDAERLPYTLAIHGGSGENPHCHLMISERTNDGLERSPEQWFRRYNAAAPEQGGARKTTALHPKAWLEETRAAWAAQTNQALERAGHDVRIDHRSLEDQGIDRVPGIHLGPHVVEMEARGIDTARGAEARRRAGVNAELAAAAEAGVQEPSAPSRWERVKQSASAWFSRAQAPAPVPDPPPAQDAPSAAQGGPAPSPALPAQGTPEISPPERVEVDEAYRRRAEQEHELRKARARILERPEEARAAVGQIQDPEQRAKAERLLETIIREGKQERQRKQERDEGWER